MDKEAIYNKLILIAQKIAEKKQGALFIIGPKQRLKGAFESLYPQIINPHPIDEQGINAVVEKLAELDGACVFTDNGDFLAFGARVKKSIPLIGYGTKHAAATGITTLIPEATAILVSEESGWIKIFKEGKIVVEMDAQKTSPPLMDKVVSFVTDNDTALLTAAGASAALVGFLPVVVVSGTYLALKTASGMIKKSFEKN